MAYTQFYIPYNLSDEDYWKNINEKELAAALRKLNTNVAKNLVLAIGNGMVPTTTTG